MRITKDEYYLNIAREVAKRGTCIRRNYGAVIVNNDKIVSTGYTGAPRGEPNCCDIGKCTRRELNVPAGERYELCRSVHAEMNACLHAGRDACIGGTIYIAGIDAKTGAEVPGNPCLMCERVIKQCGIQRVVTRKKEAMK